MNCFAARNDFVAYWQKTLTGEHRTALLAHLSGCSTCDRAFRSFALTAPVLYSTNQPDASSQTTRPSHLGGTGLSSIAPLGVARSSIARLNNLLPVFAMAAAAAIVLYFAVPPHMTFEDAIAASNSTTELASYPPIDSVFGRELMAQGATTPDLSDE